MLWLWHRLVATAPIRHLAREHPYAADAALKTQKTKKKKKKKKAKLKKKKKLMKFSENLNALQIIKVSFIK